jgi:hypothetical protein
MITIPMFCFPCFLDLFIIPTFPYPPMFRLVTPVFSHEHGVGSNTHCTNPMEGTRGKSEGKEKDERGREPTTMTYLYIALQ